MVTAQQLAEEAKQKAQYEKYRKDRQRMQLIQTPNYLNSFSKGIYNGGQKVSDLGSKLASSESPAFQEIGGKLQTFGDGMQTASGRPFVNSLKDKAGQFLASKLTPYEPGTTAIGQGLTEAIPSASSQLPSTIGTTAGTTGLEAAASGLGTGASTTAAGSGSALSGALASATGAGTAGTAAGTGSALGSAIGSATAGTTTAAGAGAAGAGLGTAALGALGPIGIGIAAASILYNLFNSAQKKKQQEAMQKDMENVAQTQQADAEKKNELMNEYDQTINNNIQNLSQETQPTTDNQGLISSLIGSIKDRFNGTPTGGASNVNNTVNTPLPNIQIPMPEEQQATEQPTVQQVAQDPQLSLKQKLFDGVKDVFAGYKDNATHGLMEGDLFKQIVPQQQEQTNDTLKDYQEQLLNAGYDQNVVDAVAQGKNSGYKEIDEWIKNNPEALQQQQGVLTGGASKVQPKSGWQRVGEAFGTGQRLLSNPIVQGLIAGSLYAKDKGDALYGLGKGVEWAQNKNKSNYYADKLGQPRTIFGSYDDKDYNAQVNADYKGAVVKNSEERNANLKAYQDAMIKQHQEDAAERKRSNMAKEAAARERNSILRNRQLARGTSAVRNNPYTKALFDRGLKDIDKKMEKLTNDVLMWSDKDKRLGVEKPSGLYNYNTPRVDYMTKEEYLAKKKSEMERALMNSLGITDAYEPIDQDDDIEIMMLPEEY